VEAVKICRCTFGVFIDGLYCRRYTQTTWQIRFWHRNHYKQSVCIVCETAAYISLNVS